MVRTKEGITDNFFPETILYQDKNGVSIVRNFINTSGKRELEVGITPYIERGPLEVVFTSQRRYIEYINRFT